MYESQFTWGLSIQSACCCCWCWYGIKKETPKEMSLYVHSRAPWDWKLCIYRHCSLLFSLYYLNKKITTFITFWNNNVNGEFAAEKVAFMLSILTTFFVLFCFVLFFHAPLFCFTSAEQKHPRINNMKKKRRYINQLGNNGLSRSGSPSRKAAKKRKERRREAPRSFSGSHKWW